MCARTLPPSGYYHARLRRQQLCRAAKKSGKKRAKSRSSYFPFHRLPSEIVAEIFVLCLPDLECPFKTNHDAPLLLCSVSSSWRTLALSVPRLWNELSIKVIKAKLDEDFSASMTEEWIARSGTLPLTLRLHAIPFNERGKVTAVVKAILDTFFHHASRWESVDIDLISCSAISFPKLGPTPLLRKFSFSTSWPVSVPFPFTSCPLLLTFTWPFPCSTASNPNIPWHQLTHINMEHIMSTRQTLDILRSCQTLIEFRAEIDDDSSLESTRPRRSPVENRSLLNFHLVVYQTCTVLLQSLTLPALTSFSLDADFDSLNFISARSVHKELLRFLTRSKCKLEKLKLGDSGFSDAGILKCLKHDSCSSLVELTIANVYNRPMFTDRVILALTDKDGLSEVNNVLLPGLSRLSLEMCLAASPGVLGLMILSRCLWWDKDDQLKSLTLIVRDWDDWDDTFLKLASDTGLSVDITIEPYSDSENIEDPYDTDDL